MTENEKAMYAHWGAWFAQPLEEKMKHLRQPGKGGYFPPASESPGFTGKPDPKEYFHWRLGHGDLPGTPTRDVFLDCYKTAQRWCIERGLKEVVDRVSISDCVLRIIHYPPHPDGNVGEAHRDFDLLTVSVEGTAPGLEIQRRDLEDEWWEPQETGIQVGEMLEIYTNNHCRGGADSLHKDCPIRSTTHRVRTAPNTDRIKAVFFYLPPMDFELRPGLTAGDYLSAAPGSRADGWVGVLKRAGTYGIGAK